MKRNKTVLALKMDQKIRWLFVFALVAFVCFMGILYQQKTSHQATRKDVYNTYATIKKLERVNTDVAESEAASRGYLLTKDPGWKKNLGLLHVHLIEAIKEIGQLSGNNTVDRDIVKALETLAQQKIAYQNELINANLITEDLLKKLRTDAEPRQITRSIKSLLAAMIQDQEKLLSERIVINEKGYDTGVLLALLGGIFAFCLVLAVLFQLNGDINLRKKAEEEATLSENKYRGLIENAGVVVFTANSKGYITFTNHLVNDLTGYTTDELMGKHFSVLIDPTWIEQVVFFYKDQFEKRVHATTLNFLTRTKSGEKKWVEQYAQLLYEDDRVIGFQCMVKDITQKVMIEFELNESEQKRKENEYRLNAILDNTTTLIFIKDLKGHYIMVNKRFKEVMGLTDGMVINKTDYDFTPKELADHYKKLDEEVIAGRKSIESEELVETSQGKRNLLLVKFPLLDDRKTVFGISGIATDITERVQSRQELEIALKKAEDAKQLQDQFLANTSHEIRTPLNGIQGMTRLLLETKLTDDQRDFTNMIERSLNNLGAILNDVLDFSNIQAGKLTLEKIEFDIIEALESVKNEFAHRITDKGLDFRVLIDNTVPPSLTGDPYRLKQVLVNLVGNAVKFTKKGGIQIHVNLKQKTEKSARLLFTVKDTGIGISGEKLESIFESFAQANMDISRRYGGAGLGLAISKGLVQLQGGSIAVKSIPDEGSVFSFDIPYGLKQNTDSGSAQFDYALRLKDKNFLVVEDNEVNQKLIGFVLKKAGGLVDIASNGQEAISYFEQNRVYDLIIMDLQMPVMDGYETAIYLRETLKLKTPIIAMTATALKGDQEKCKQVGMDDFMLKPFDFNDLYKRLVGLLFNEGAEAGADAKKSNAPAKMYDLSLLEELDDKESLLDVLTLFLDNTPPEVKELSQLVKQKSWTSLFRLAHKIKGAVAILQATHLSGLLGKIEENAKEEKDLSAIETQVEEVSRLFTEMEIRLREEHALIKKELS